MSDLSPGQVAERSGLTVATLHYYEREGLIRAARTAGNQRRFARDTLRRLAFIGAAQRVGLSLARIREALQSLPQERAPTADDWARLSAVWQDELNDRIAALERLRDDLSGCIRCGCLSLDRCALYNPGDEYGRTHPGKNRL